MDNGNNENLEQKMSRLGQELRSMAEDLGESIKNGVEDLGWSINDILQTSGNDLDDALEPVKQDIEKLADSVANYFQAVWDVIHARYERVKTLFAIEDGIEKVEDATGLDLSGLYAKVEEQFKKGGQSFSEEVKQAQTMNEVEKAVDTLKGYFTQVRDALMGDVDEAKKKLS